MYPEPKKIVVSILADKNYQEMLTTLRAISNSEIILTTFNYPRAMTTEEVLQIGEEEGISVNPNWQQALNNLYKGESESDAKIFVTGSLYFISEVRNYLLTSTR